MEKSNLVKTHLGEMEFWFDEKDSFIGQRIALGKYEEFESKLLIDQLNEGDTAIDIGANIGFYTLLMAKRVGNRGKVYAFEPEKNNYSILVKNIESNGLGWVKPIQAAVSDKRAKLSLYISNDNFGDHRIYQSENREKKEVTETMSLSDYLKDEEKINLVKIDTQGWEPKVIKGAEELIKKFKPNIFLEYWPKGYQMAGTDGKEMLDHLMSEYRSIYLIDDYLNTYTRIDKKDIDNIVRLKECEYLDLFLTDKLNFRTIIDRFCQLRLKKLAKKLLRKGDR